ncbi:hypothetical protein HLH17_02030 [Acinetobacter sp. ANC 5380]|uniref:Uncharacterized protein n=1 Tax=Acinetobacter terrae TaxID=2731247 RepID=A0A7Y2RD44_9GAMM|nr:hypothetical protein [Acinetobacter terrae]NNH76482.1 hypothetical protein [Acinetobacter terrae]
MDIEIQLTTNNMGVSFTGLKVDFDNFVEIIYHILPFANNYEEEDIQYLLGFVYDLRHSSAGKSKKLATAQSQVILPTLLLQLAILAKYRNQFEESLGDDAQEFDIEVVETLKGLESVIFECIETKSVDAYNAALGWFNTFEYDPETYLFSIADNFIANTYIENTEFPNRIDALANVLSTLNPAHPNYVVFAKSLHETAINDGISVFDLQFNDLEIYEKVGSTETYAW